MADLLAPLAPALCAGCGAGAGSAEPLCGRCRSALTWLPAEPVGTAAMRVWAPVAYEGPARALVRALKFGGAWRVAETMAAQIAANAPPSCLEYHMGTPGRIVLVPVPLHPRRVRHRGYDQAALLARALSERTGLQVSECLARTGSPKAQVGRNRTERLAGPPGTIRASETPPAYALLVDDVVTSGGTLAACAAALRAVGTRQVSGIAYARTPGR